MEITKVTKRRNNSITIDYSIDGELYALIISPEEIVENHNRAHLPVEADLPKQCAFEFHQTKDGFRQFNFCPICGKQLN